MSLNRFIYYSAVVGGWAAYVAWIAAELFVLGRHRLGGAAKTILTAALVGAAVGAGLQLVSGMTNRRWRRQLKRASSGLIGGGLGGTLGGLLGSILYSTLGLPRAIGWLIMGLAIGASDGICERSPRKLRNGLIGGAAGGLVGGLLFDPIASAGSDLPSRVTAFVILGVSIGAMIGLAQVVFKEAWLTVLDGYRPGRQLVLTSTVTSLGRGDHLPLPFLGPAGRDLESEHARIIRQPDGQYVCEDNHSRIGTLVNHQPVDQPVLLRDGDLIRLGANIIRFNHRVRGAGRDQVALRDAQAGPQTPGQIPAPPPPPAAGRQPA
ncbi:MAG TPA: FHA domain-containing protein, partial [Planctomycetaceae bacterium]|nr:FHA domain-containing protein [Planctomycetaceae bacterium]